MSDLSFRFLHAADFQLDLPLHGVRGGSRFDQPVDD